MDLTKIDGSLFLIMYKLVRTYIIVFDFSFISTECSMCITDTLS